MQKSTSFEITLDRRLFAQAFIDGFTASLKTKLPIVICFDPASGGFDYATPQSVGSELIPFLDLDGMKFPYSRDIAAVEASLNEFRAEVESIIFDHAIPNLIERIIPVAQSCAQTRRS